MKCRPWKSCGSAGRLIGATIIGAALAGAGFSTPAGAQTRDAGPWWPHPVWGPDDQAGASNRITEAKVMEALQLASSGTIYELGQIYEQEMPLFGTRSYSMVLPVRAPAATRSPWRICSARWRRRACRRRT